MTVPTNLIITGNPGIGKTTLLKECAYPYADDVGGFFTEEIRMDNERAGFNIRTFDGQEGVFAMKGLKSATKLNKYGIDLDVMKKVGVPAVEAALLDKKVVVIDEIGSMEMMSKPFCDVVTRVLGEEKPFLASIRLKAEPFTSQIKKLNNAKVLTLTKENFLKVKNEVRAWLEKQCQP